MTRMRYERDPGWIVERAGDQIVARAGADHVFALDGVPREAAHEVLASIDGPPRGPCASARAAEALSQLVALGALRPGAGPEHPGPLRAALRCAAWAPPPAT